MTLLDFGRGQNTKYTEPNQMNPLYHNQSKSSSYQPHGKLLNGSSSSPVQPIEPLLKLGSKGQLDSTRPGIGLSLPPNPIFDESTPKNVSALKDNSAYLHCLVHSLGNKSVSILFYDYVSIIVILKMLNLKIILQTAPHEKHTKGS